MIGGLACLDFIDTAALGSPVRVEALHDFGDLLTWLYEERLIADSERRRGRRRWDAGPAARRTFARALVLRRTLHEAVKRILAHRSVPKPAIAAIRDVLGKLAGSWELTRTKTGFVLKFRPRFDQSDQLLGPIAKSACDLLCHRDWSRLKCLRESHLRSLFLRQHQEPSPPMVQHEDLRNRMKAATFYRRQRAARPSLTS